MTTFPSAADLSLAQQVSLLSGGGFWKTQAIAEAGIPSAVVSDGPHGLRYQEDAGDHLALGASVAATCFPTAVTLASTWDEELADQVGSALATEATALGVDVVLGPGLNIKRHPLCGRNFEYFSEDPLVSGRFAAALVNGLQRNGVGACLKHYAVNNQESHRFVVDAVVDERTLRELYLAGFEHAVKASKPWAVMAAYNLINGSHATEHRQLLTQILRDEWSFDGLVMSDWAATSDRVAAIAAGMDLEMPSSHGLFDAAVLAAMAAGQLSREAVTTSAQRVLDLVARSRRRKQGAIPADLHDALARRVAAEGTVLLANDGTLPLAQGISIAVIGAFAEQPRYQGSGSSQVNPTQLTSALDEFARRGIPVRYAAGYDPRKSVPDAALIAEAVAAARSSDVALVLVGLPGIKESEGFDRENLDLPEQHNAIVSAVAAVNSRTVVALSNGAPVLMPWRHDVAAILESYLGGQASGGALVDVLYGDGEPGGRLAETFPASLDDVAADPYFPGHPHQVEYREGLFVGYRFTTTSNRQPLFPFGHGLGYSRIEWSNISCERSAITAGDSVTIEVTLTNSSARAGSDVVQVYLHDRTGVALRPRRELAGFAKIRLQPGETVTESIEIPARAFAFYDVSLGDWRTPQGNFDLEIARSSTDIVGLVTISVVNGVATSPEMAGSPLVAATDAHFAARLGTPIPLPREDAPFTRESTMGEISVTRLGRTLRNLVWKTTPLDAETKADETAVAFLERAVAELPLRGAAIFSGGKISLPLVDALLEFLNRRPGRGLRAVAQLMASKHKA